MTELQYQQQLEQYNALGEEIEEMLVALMDA